MPGLRCRELEGVVVEMARRSPLSGDECVRVTEHLAMCEHCRMTFDRQVSLGAATRVLAVDAARFSAPASIEQTLHREIASLYGLRRRRMVYGYLGGAIAAMLALVGWIAYPPVPPLPSVATSHRAWHADEPVDAPLEPAKSAGRKRIAKRAAPPDPEFMEIPYTLPLEPYERADVMRIELPVAALIAAGLPMSMADPAALARADVLVGQDGRARAIRLISISTSN